MGSILAYAIIILQLLILHMPLPGCSFTFVYAIASLELHSCICHYQLGPPYLHMQLSFCSFSFCICHCQVAISHLYMPLPAWNSIVVYVVASLDLHICICNYHFIA